MLAACGDNDGGDGGERFYEPGPGVFVINQGQYGQGGATVDFYDPDDKEVENAVYKRANKAELGDSFQSVVVYNGKAYACVLGSGKIVVFDADTFVHLGVISGLVTPSYIIPVSDTKMYVVDMYQRDLTIINPQTYKVTGTVTVPGLARSVASPAASGDTRAIASAAVSGNYAYYYHGVFATDYSANDEIFKIDITTDTYVATLNVTQQPNSLVIDKNNYLWVLSDGRDWSDWENPTHEIAALTKIDLSDFSIEDEIEFTDIDQTPKKLTINGSGDKLYYLNNGNVYQMDVTARALPATALVSTGSYYIEGLGVDPSSSEIYVADQLSYNVEEGMVYRYSADGQTKMDEFQAGLFPGAFCFKQ